MEALAKSGCHITAVISNRKEARGLKIAKELGIKTFYINQNKFFYTKLESLLVELKAELIVLAGFMKLVPESFVSKFNNKIINIHPSLLPAFKGLNAQKQALEAGVKISGCSVHLVNAQMDEGRVLAQSQVKVEANDSLESLSARILEQEHLLLPAVVKAIQEGKIVLNNSSAPILSLKELQA